MSEEDDADNVTLLYKLAEGACPSSFGFNAARLAGLPEELVQHARRQARKLQDHPRKMALFANLMRVKEMSELKNVIVSLKELAVA
jgi:DNA mismatch repair protein MSH6